MSLIRPAALGLAVVMVGPAIWQAVVTGGLDLTSAVFRFLIAVPVAGLMLALLRFVTSDYGQPPRQERAPAAADKPNRRASDRTEAED